MNSLEYLTYLINRGWEFPNAVYKVSVKYRLTTDEVSALEVAYDAIN